MASALFARDGFGAVTMDGVAAGVGVTKPLLYNYFGNKEQLFLACLGRTGDAFEASVRAAVEAAPHPGDGLKGALRAFTAFIAADRDAWVLLYDPTLPTTGPIAEQVAGYRERLTRLIALQIAALSRGASSHSRSAGVQGRSAEAEVLAAGLLAAAEAMGRWWLRTGALAPDAVAEILIDTLEPGLARRALRQEPHVPQ